MIAEATKLCTVCGDEKPPTEFALCSNGKWGRAARCKQCKNKKTAADAATRRAAGRTADKKVCRACGLEKPGAEFTEWWQSSDGLASYCKLCESVRKRMRAHSLTKEQVLELLAVPACQCCGHVFENDFEKKIDHCHTHKHVRGVLCHACNTSAQGTAQESLRRCHKVIAYLERDLEWQACELLTDNSLPTSPPNIAPAPFAGGRKATAEDEWRFTTLSEEQDASMTGAISSRSAQTAMQSYTPAQLSLDFRT